MDTLFGERIAKLIRRALGSVLCFFALAIGGGITSPTSDIVQTVGAFLCLAVLGYLLLPKHHRGQPLG